MAYIEEFDPITGYRTDDPSAPRYIPGKLYPRNHRKLWDQNFDPVTDLRTDASSPANMTPDQLDPLEAASSPIAVEPSVGGADQAQIRRLMDKGMSYQRAAARVADEKAVASEEFQARIDAADAAAAASRNVPAPVAPEEPTVSPETIREYGYMSQAEPGPRKVLGGGKPVVGKQFDKMSEAIDYMTRPPVMDANRHLANPGAAYLESPRDRDMRLRGFFPVFADDGSVSYSVGTGPNALYPKDKGIPGGLGRLGPRKDLQETDPSQPGFILDKADGPTGMNYIYKQNAAARDQQAAYMTERQLYRMAEAAGMSPAEFAAQNEGAFGAIAANPEAKARMMVQGKRQADEAKRTEAWRSQMMLAGSNPARNSANAFSMLSPDDQQKVLLSGFTGGKTLNEMDPRIQAAQIAANADTETARLDRDALDRRQAAVDSNEDRRHRERIQQGDTEASDRSTAASERLLALQAQLETLRQQGDQQRSANDLTDRKLQSEEAARKAAIARQFMDSNPGAYHTAIGLQTPEADKFLKSVARTSDRFQFLPGGGFGYRESGAMNSALLALARQAESAGVPTRLSDRDYREDLIRRYGYSSGWAGGRGGWFGDFFQPIPEDPSVAPRQP
jgi:hypothetical protein